MADTAAPVVLIQDYHFALAPLGIRCRLPQATTVLFWHIPWPNRHDFAIARGESSCSKGSWEAASSASRPRPTPAISSRPSSTAWKHRSIGEARTVTYNGRRVLIGTYPISIEWPSRLVGRGTIGCRNAAGRSDVDSVFRTTRCSPWEWTGWTTRRGSKRRYRGSSSYSKAVRVFGAVSCWRRSRLPPAATSTATVTAPDACVMPRPT